MNPLDASANQHYNVTTLGDTTLTGKLVLVRIVVNKKGASSNTATVYDGSDSDVKIGIIDTTDRVGSIEYGLPCLTGIKISVATGTAPDLTVVYREQP